MSIYDFAAANFTTSDDLRRHPAVDKWQIVRTFLFVLVVFGAMYAVAHGS